jgi:uncharacterized protein (TIGR03382 family)
MRTGVGARRIVEIGAALAIASTTAFAQRPALAGEATHGGGDVLVHYATTGVDAVPMADTNTDGVPDFVTEVAAAAELGLARFRALGFRRPLADGTLGGDDRIDIYLRDLSAADGNAGIDSCVANQCIGFAVAENDYAGFGYPSVGEGIRSVVPHELFHLVQYAYDMDQPTNWTEGSAVWAVENLYGDQNSDFERFLPTFLTRTYRPFERASSGFGDTFAYGAALWPYFLEQRFGAGAVVATWAACEAAPFLDAVDTTLAARGASLDDAWIEFTRWNALTGSHATSGTYPAAQAWGEAPREPALGATGTIDVEGLSARYVPITIAARSTVTLAPQNGIRIAGWVIADGAAFDDGIELVDNAATIDAGAYTLVVTGLSRGTITTAVDVAIGEPLEEDDDDQSGCASSSTTPALPIPFIVLVALRRRRR